MDALCDAVRAAYPHGPEAVVDIVRAAFTVLGSEIAVLRAEVAELRRRVEADSTTSSKPPSADVSRAVRPISLREPSGRPPGGQPGHRGTTLAWHAAPDMVVPHRPAACAHCGQPFAADTRDLGAGGEAVERAQVVDLPPVALRTTEHRRVAVVCPTCGETSVGAFPPGVGGDYSVRYGPELKALAVALHSAHFVPYARTAELLDALLGPGPSTGTLARWTREAAGALRPAQRAAAAAIAQSPTAHADETGLHVARTTWWLHVAATATHTHYHVDRRRGVGGIDAGGVWADFRGVLVHDALASYFRYDRAAHQLCLAHLRREAKGLYALTEQLDAPEGWLRDVAGLLGRVHRLVWRAAAAGRAALAPRTVRRLTTRYDTLVAEARRRHPYPVPGRPGAPRGRPKRGPVAAFADRLRKYRDDILRCTTDARIPPDNNQAERDLRMGKLVDKISGGFRTPAGAHAFATLRSALSTARKQGRTSIACLREAFAPLAPHTLGTRG